MNTLLYVPKSALPHTLPTRAPQRPATPAVLSALGQALRAGLLAWQRRRMAQAALRTLQSLDGHALRDLGLDRSELSSLAHRPEDPTRARARWSC